MLIASSMVVTVGCQMSDIIDTSGDPRPWTNGIIKYYFDSSLSVEQIHLIQKGMLEWSDKTNVSFIEVSSDKYALKIFLGKRNEATIGHQSRNFLKLSSFKARPIMHELGHVIGLYHEQCRQDRDQYIVINYDNISDDAPISDFDKQYQFYDIRNYEYDYDSIMQYSSFAYSKDIDSPTITKVDGSRIYQSSVISQDDIKKVNEIYK
jgi:hypothetical protein